MGGSNFSRLKSVIKLLRDKFRLLVAVYTEHCKLKKHLFNMSKASCVNCQFTDMEPETLEHLMSDYTVVCKRRLKALRSIDKYRDQISSIVPSRLLFFIVPCCDSLCREEDTVDLRSRHLWPQLISMHLTP